MLNSILDSVSCRKVALSAAAAIMLSTGSVSAHQCPRDMTIPGQFAKAERVFLAYVVETKLEEGLQLELEKKEPGFGGEYVKLVSAGYRVIEEFKGDKSYQPRLLDLMGIGTGYAGLTPGSYFLVTLPPRSGDDQIFPPVFRRVDQCTVPLSHYRLASSEFRKHLDEVRSLARAK